MSNQWKIGTVKLDRWGKGHYRFQNCPGEYFLVENAKRAELPRGEWLVSLMNEFDHVKDTWNVSSLNEARKLIAQMAGE